jgi:alkylation response protein AidB-like acyl-CoA dehydrogenase
MAAEYAWRRPAQTTLRRRAGPGLAFWPQTGENPGLDHFQGKSMNFEFSEDQNMLRDQARRFLDENCPPSVVRKVLDSDAEYDPTLWKKIVDMGWTAAVIPEELGGLGLSYLELCVIAEELGRAVAPVPFSSSVYLATEALLLAGSTEQKEAWLPKLAAGEAIGTFAMAEGAGRTSPKTLETKVKGGKLTGSKTAVPDAAIADVMVVLAAHGSGDGAALYHHPGAHPGPDPRPRQCRFRQGCRRAAGQAG